MVRLALLLALLLTVALGLFRIIPAHLAVLISGVFALAASLAGFVLQERWDINWVLLVAGLVLVALSKVVARWPHRGHPPRVPETQDQNHERR